MSRKLVLADVIVQMSLGRERLLAACNVAKIWLFAGVRPKVCFQVTFFIEATFAVLIRTNILLFSRL